MAEHYYMENAIARTLQVKRHQIIKWSLAVNNNGQAMHIGSHRVGISGTLTATLDIELAFDSDKDCYALQARDLKGVSLAALQMQSQGLGHLGMTGSIHLFYSKETQHIFKALLQQFTVRGPQKRKKRK